MFVYVGGSRAIIIESSLTNTLQTIAEFAHCRTHMVYSCMN